MSEQLFDAKLAEQTGRSTTLTNQFESVQYKNTELEKEEDRSLKNDSKVGDLLKEGL
jgi:hypothetical protein